MNQTDDQLINQSLINQCVSPVLPLCVVDGRSRDPLYYYYYYYYYYYSSRLAVGILLCDSPTPLHPSPDPLYLRDVVSVYFHLSKPAKPVCKIATLLSSFVIMLINAKSTILGCAFDGVYVPCIKTTRTPVGLP